jgi:hypothetical protein
MTEPTSLVIIIDGPVGLAAAVHAVGRGPKSMVRGQGPAIGHVVRQWGHMPMFSNRASAIDSADPVIDASHTWFAPNPAGAGSLPGIGKADAGGGRAKANELACCAADQDTRARAEDGCESGTSTANSPAFAPAAVRAAC